MNGVPMGVWRRRNVAITAEASLVGHVFGQEGVMVNMTLEGAKFSKLKK